MADDYRVVNLEDLSAFAKEARPNKGKDTVASRIRREKPVGIDGRRAPKPEKPREVPLNVDVLPAIKELAALARVKHGRPMKAFVAEAIEHYWRFLESGGGNAE